MSNAGQAVLTVAGTIVGTYFGYPQLGFVLGSLAGQALYPTQLPAVTGPKLTDRNTTSAQVGDPVPWIFGTDFSACEVIWVDELETVTNTEHQGKGGPSQDFTTYTYFQSIAFGICGTYPTVAYGPGTKELLRLWENGKLMYDVRPQGSGESDSDYETRLSNSAEYASTFVFYDGSEDQEPDPTIEATRGVGRTPAYRGLCYIVFPRRQLQDDQGRRHPSIRAEVGSCTADFGATRIFTKGGVSYWRKPHGLVSATVTCIGGGEGGGSGGSNIPEGIGITTGGGGGGGGGAARDTLDADELPNVVTVIVGGGGQGANQNTEPLSHGKDGDPGGDSSFGDLVIGRGGGTAVAGQGGLGTPQIARGGNGGGPGEDTSAEPVGLGNGRPAGAGGGNGGAANQFGGADGFDGGDGEADPDGPPPGAGGGLGGTLGDGGPPEILAGPGFAGRDSLIYHGGGGGGGGGGTRGGHGGNGGRGGKYGGGGGGGGGGTTGDEQPFGGPGGPGAPGIVIVEQDFGDSDPCELAESLGLICQAICERCGLIRVDTSSIDDVTLRGYSISKQTTGRAAIDPLRSVGWFDVAEVGTQLLFVRRGGAAVATLSEDDLGAYEAGSQPGPAITTKKSQDPDMPRVVRVHYFAISRDYEFGEQVSPVRVTTRATNEIDVDLPVPLEDLQAAQIAEALWASSWTGAHTHEANISWGEWAALIASDPIIVPVDEALVRMRIVDVVDQSLMIRKLALVRDDDDNYETVAIATAPERPPSVIAIKAPTLMALLDIAPLREEDDDIGIYAAVAAATGSSWLGAVIFRSCDLGASWEPLTDQLSSTIIGEVYIPVGEGPTESYDGATLTVDIPDWMPTPQSVTDEQLYAGANAFAVGANGRWEVAQFRDAVQVDPGRWELTNLRRGRRGTEHVMGTMQAGDRFVLLDESTLTRLPVEEALLLETCSYRPVTVGATFSSGSDQQEDHEHTGEALRPFSPTDVVAERETDDDIVVTATRRDRLVFTLELPLPMNEDSLAWELDVVVPGSSPDDVLRTISSPTLPITYTAAQQVADGANLLPALEFKLYQMSATVGRGTPGVVVFED